MNNIIDCKVIASNILLQISNQIKLLNTTQTIIPTLAIVVIGNNQSSTIYVRNKINAANSVGIKTILVELSTSISTNSLVQKINELNLSADISGIIVQLPLPIHLDKKVILTSIDYRKDVDGFHPLNVGYLNAGFEKGFVPATALGIIAIINHLSIKMTGLEAVIIGRSNLVGKPTSSLLLQQDCSVTICHSKTNNLATITKRADIIISAIGKPKFLNTKFFTAKNFVIDVGINKDPISGKICGDVDFKEVQPMVKFITPVPGGVGLLTIACLLQNTLKAFTQQNNH
ncbi:MAG: bifunctional 5,10-methylenetetrahydrofolate dehydrogenase/5,10-methenyltetrahydrofolate cyclohydrolase [Rickettsiaceae bacterium]|nr:MAG: bifunctional 5,10-methylenetetrahydrofolate dehydrogenase/5,10-methenyltetrahydrofolate cyclohydrolase [Rickettsiaceae bacterium]